MKLLLGRQLNIVSPLKLIDMKKVILLSVFVFTANFLFAQGQGTRTQQQQATIKLNEVMDLSMTSVTPLYFEFNSAADYENGIQLNGATQFQVKSNRLWKVNFKATSSHFSGGDGSMVSEVLSLKKSGGTFQSLKSTDSVDPLATGNRGSSSVAGNTFSVDYKANPGYLYDISNYSIDIVYTLSQQ